MRLTFEEDTKLKLTVMARASHQSRVEFLDSLILVAWGGYRRTAVEDLQGSIEDVQFYPRALTPTEIHLLYLTQSKQTNE